jgi:hypothetical protein
MKLSDILEADVIDFAAKRKEKEFMDKVGAMSGDADEIASDVMAAQGRDEALAQDVLTKYGREIRAMRKFLESPIMSGGFKTGYNLNQALNTWRKNPAHKEKLRRSVQKAALDNDLFHEVQKHYALWSAITNHYPMEVMTALPARYITDFEVFEDLEKNLRAARRQFAGH